MTASLEGIHFDHNAPEHPAKMRSLYADLREHCPVLHAETYGGFYVLSRYDDVVRVLKDHETFISSQKITIPPMTQAANAIPTESDEPDHTHYRRVLWPFMTPRAVAGYEGIVRSTVTRLINDFIEDGQAEILDQLAKPVPALVTGRFFGFTDDEGRHLYDLIDTMISVGPLDPARGAAAGAELYEILEGSLRAARENPTDNVSSAIVTYNHEGRTFTPEECVGLLSTAISGALATTVTAIAEAIVLFWKYPDQRKLLQDNPDLVSGAVEEVLRMEPPAHAPARTVTRECSIGGVALVPGDRVLLLYGSANHDPAAFDDVDLFKIDRPRNSHVSFSQGIHKCEGQHLARLELKVVIEEFLRRIPEYEVVNTPVERTAGGVLTLDRVDITFPPGSRIDE